VKGEIVRYSRRGICDQERSLASWLRAWKYFIIIINTLMTAMPVWDSRLSATYVPKSDYNRNQHINIKPPTSLSSSSYFSPKCRTARPVPSHPPSSTVSQRRSIRLPSKQALEAPKPTPRNSNKTRPQRKENGPNPHRARAWPCVTNPSNARSWERSRLCPANLRYFSVSRG